MKSHYKRLGDYIREVNVRNRDLAVTKLVGLTIDKAFISSVANVIGTDMSNYKVICKGQFACSLMQVSRDERIPIAMLRDDEAIMSPAYPIFEVINTRELLPEYLMMWFSRSEFDREASFYAVGGVRGSLTWEDFCNLTLPIPAIEVQREIVAEYECLSRRIAINEQLCEKLESTASALYRKMFIDNIDPENLPHGWRMGTLGDTALIVTGKLNSEDATESGQYPFFTCSQETYKTDTFSFNQEAVILGGNNASAIFPLKIYKGKFNAYQRTYVISSKEQNVTNKQIYFMLSNELESFKGSSQGTTTKFLTIKILNEIPIIVTDYKTYKEFDESENILFDRMTIMKQETNNLKEVQSLLLSKLATN